MMDMFSAALAYAERGWPVFPLRPRDKTPIVDGGFKAATTDLDQVRSWWADYPDANIGATPPDGIVVVDVDGDEGATTLESLESGHGSLPETATVVTARGRHLWFRVDGQVRQGAGILGPGLDTRVSGRGYVLLPPSVHPDGHVYRWLDPTVEPADAPEWLVEMLRPPRPSPRPSRAPRRDGPVNGRLARYAAAALEREVAAVRAAPEGTRNHQLNASAFALGQLVAGGELDAAHVEAELVEAAEAAGLPATEAMRTLASGLRAGADHPRAAPEPSPPARHNGSDPRPSQDTERTVSPTLDGASLLSEVEKFVRRFVVLSPAQSCAVALWVAHTHAIEAAEATPYLGITSPEKRSGKTRLLEVLELLAADALRAANMSDAYLFRSVAERRRTILLDEVDAVFGRQSDREDLRALLNAGYRRGAVVGRCETEGRKVITRDYDAFGPKALAGIGDLPDTIADRAIPIRLQRRHRGERVERFRIREATPQGQSLRDALGGAFGAPETLERLHRARPQLPESLDDRAQDGWEPLLAIADLAGADWPTRARAAAAELHGAGAGDDSAGVLVLRHIRDVFEEREDGYLSTAILLEILTAREDGPWGAWWGPDVEKGRTRGPASRLARLLRPYGIRPGKVGPRDGRVQGYERAHFAEVWARYLDADDSLPDTGPDASLPVSVSANGHTDNPSSEAVSDPHRPPPETPPDLHVSECPSFRTDTGRDTDGEERCCESGPLEPRCALCPSSPSYWREDAAS